MKFLRGILDKQKPMFQKGGKLEKFHYLFEAGETFLFVPNEVTPKKGAQIRDAIDLFGIQYILKYSLMNLYYFS